MSNDFEVGDKVIQKHTGVDGTVVKVFDEGSFGAMVVKVDGYPIIVIDKSHWRKLQICPMKV